MENTYTPVETNFSLVGMCLVSFSSLENFENNLVAGTVILFGFHLETRELKAYIGT